MKKKMINIRYTIETRTIIENKLNENWSITQIANYLKRDNSNVAKEINKHHQFVFPSYFNTNHPCLKYKDCEFKEYQCYLTCKNIEFNLCEKLNSSPHVCNGCLSKRNCRHVKIYYKANEANNEYLNSWKNDRTGLRYSEEELNIINNDFRVLVINTRSVYHSLIVINNRDFNFKLQTVYKQIERGQLELKSYELPRCRKVTKKEEKDKSYKRENIDGHTYEDYKKFKENNINAVEMQMDTVEGIKNLNAHALLTLEIVSIKFIFIFKISKQNALEVRNKLNELRTILGDKIIDKIFEIILTDNGKEFIKLSELQEALANANIFYCHPYSSFEKGAIKNNHELIRRVIPKGISLKPYSQKDLDLLCSHINSLYRESLDGLCPFDKVYEYISKKILDKLNLKKIDDDKVILSPKLLGDKNINNIKKYLNDKEIKEANILL